MKPDPIFQRQDWIAAAIVTLGAFAVYAWTAAPGVTMLDSGEFLTAAVHFGVPHPTGYPLWTLLAWLWQLLPLGHPAWEIALFSGVLGALATGLLCALGSSVLRWNFPELPGRVRHLAAIVVSGCFALSEPVWSQAVIAEVYTLHAFLSGCFLLALYSFIRKPESISRLVLSFFLLALAFGNHQLSLAWTPLPFLAVLLLRRDLLADLVAASLLTAVLFYLGFGLLGRDWPTLKTSLRFTWLVLGGFAWFVLVRRGRIEWRLVAWLPLVIAAGLLPYLYLPLASGTNPPMNWGYARDTEGFYSSINRSQYGGSLDELLLRTVGKITGTSALAEKKSSAENEQPLLREPSRFQRSQQWIGFFWARLIDGFTPVGLLCFLLALALLRSADLPRRAWLYLCTIAFFLSAFLQPILDKARIDQSGWWLQRPFHTYTQFAFALVVLIGAGVLYQWLQRRRAQWLGPLSWASVLLLLWPAWFNVSGSTQRGHWSGWIYGHEMLANLPKGAIVFGGTDPGRFIPTWMILGESQVDPKWKRDPDFDRRDLYIITQNALVDPLYLKYLRDHYSEARPRVKNTFERWLGREHTYPETPIQLPSEDDLREEVEKILEAGQEDLDAHSAIAEWIFEHNKDSHAFYVEESFPMEWTYRHGEPEGFLIRLEPEEIPEIAPEVIEKDFSFWQSWIDRWENDPTFLRDYDARRSFGKLRTSQANLYRHRKLNDAAARAYRQALQLDPSNAEALLPLSNLEWDENRFEEIIDHWRLATHLDPNNDYLWYLRAVAERRKTRQEEAAALQSKLDASPENSETWQQLVALWMEVFENEKALDTLARALNALPDDSGLHEFAISATWRLGAKERSLESARRLTEIHPTDYETWLTLASVEAQMGQNDEAASHVARALEISEIPARREIRQNPVLRPILQNPEFLSKHRLDLK